MARKKKEAPKPPDRLSPDEVVRKCKHLASLGVSLNATDLVDLGAFVFSLSAVQEQLLAQFLVENGSGPLLLQYSQDTTPVRRRKAAQQSGLASSSKRRSIRTSGDFLVQQIFISTIDAKGTVIHRLFHPPAIAIAYGKTGSGACGVYPEMHWIVWCAWLPDTFSFEAFSLGQRHWI